ncbi:MAG: hypothetical protein K6253_01405, partial [Candidatus Liberibacter asiaticus]|nr:hypothetical protein [Candidatus Liberibacter asiaticus]
HLQILVLSSTPTGIILITLLMFVGRNMAIQSDTNLSKLKRKINLVKLMLLPFRFLTNYSRR